MESRQEIITKINLIFMSRTEKHESKEINIDDLTSQLKNPELYEGKETEIQCMDGRINGGHGLAGSGILLERGNENPDLPAGKYMKIFREKVEKGELKDVCWHSNCGAAGLYLKGKGIEPTEEAKDAAAKYFAEKLGEELGLPVKKSGHEMAHHSEQGIYVDSTGRLNTKSKHLPNGFLLNPDLTGDLNYHLAEIEVAISISFGGHGPGPDKFSPANRYFIMLINDPDKPDYFRGYADKIQSLIDTKFPQFANKIAVKTVTPELK